MEIQNQHTSKVLSFLDLLGQENKIEIPIIQRDYAQGRRDNKEVRVNFLNAIFESINEEIPLRLDFIYGSVIDKNFQPLDGQQRLTTLFLLHWYAAQRGNVAKSEKSILNKFSYETRITSREFCNSLVSNEVEIDENKELSSLIKDSKWFFLSWSSDPTIDSMLRTIDDINIKFYNIENLWDKLLKSKLISFYYVELDNIGLTDDLYIKMNARGKLLSAFENFKASFEKLINDNNWEVNLTEKETFAFKIDTTWTDFFWSNFKRDNLIDNSFMRFISTIAMIRLSIEKTNNRISIITSLNDNPNNVRPNYFSEEGFKYLAKCFELYSNRILNNDLDIEIPMWRHKPEKNILNEIVYEDRTVSYSQKVLFFAQNQYLMNNTLFDQANFLDWIRVVRNIISRGNVVKGGKRPDIIRSPEAFDGVINLISELSAGSGNIYEFLSGTTKLNSQYSREQVEEERKKAKLIVSNPDLKETILKMEDCALFKGRILFAFDCIDYYTSSDVFNRDLFEKVYEVIKLHFDNDDEDLISNDVRRALFTIDVNGSYEFYGYWWSYWNIGNAHKRCMIENFRELEYYIYNTQDVLYLKKLILKLTELSLDEIIENFVPPISMPNWKIRLIKEPDLLDKKSKSNYFAVPSDDSCCHLLISKRPRDLDGCFTVV